MGPDRGLRPRSQGCPLRTPLRASVGLIGVGTFACRRQRSTTDQGERVAACLCRPLRHSLPVMRGRFTQHDSWAEVCAFFKVSGLWRIPRPRYNIAPTTGVDVPRQSEQEVEQRHDFVTKHGGLVPFRWKKPIAACPRHSKRAPNPSPPNRCSATCSKSFAASIRLLDFAKGRGEKAPSNRIGSRWPRAFRAVALLNLSCSSNFARPI